MFSTYGDTVLDPFWGTGTTTLAAMVAGRDSVGYERDPEFRTAFDDLVSDVPTLARERVDARLAAHREFVTEREADGNPPGYEAEHYDFPVVTKQERSIRLYDAVDVERVDDSPASEGETRYVVTHEPR
jgi:site-specific DNA-methyltransferase (cytosine-N4-specific)